MWHVAWCVCCSSETESFISTHFSTHIYTYSTLYFFLLYLYTMYSLSFSIFFQHIHHTFMFVLMLRGGMWEGRGDP